MALSNLAKNILGNPMGYLDIEHEPKIAIDPSQLYSTKKITSCTEDSYVVALKSIRALASRRGTYEGKDEVRQAIDSYAESIWFRFSSLNKMNQHLKGIFGCELPTRYREKYQAHFKGGVEPVNQTTVVNQNTVVEPTNEVSLTIEGLSFTLSKGASMTIGELTTKTLDFKGLKSVTIDRVANGQLYGVRLDA